ncbi:MAG: CopG family transcriptional regulator [Acidobacteria bacterium]|nr:CopG family transcriptional regulator [Acidobacteriota bacterium]
MSKFQIEVSEQIGKALGDSALQKGKNTSDIISEAIHVYLKLEQAQMDEIFRGIHEADQGEFANEEDLSRFFGRWELDAP